MRLKDLTQHRSCLRRGVDLLRSEAHGFLLLLYLSVSLFPSCTPTGGHSVKILRWRCQNTEEMMICNLRVRKRNPDEIEAAFISEYFDQAGQKIDLCKDCKKTIPDEIEMVKRSEQPGNADNKNPSIDPTKPWGMSWGYEGNDSEREILTSAPVTAGIKSYKFYFLERNSGKITSNTVSGIVSVPASPKTDSAQQ
jgi:hypothetical protein